MATGITFKSAKTTASHLASRACHRILLALLVCFATLHPAKAFPPGAITCQEDINFNGNIVTVDSFDSRDPLHSSWPDYPAGRGYGVYTNTGATANPHRKANGNVATDSHIFYMDYATIFGHIAVGPSVSITLSPITSVGDLNWAPDTIGIQPGYFTNNMTAVFQPVSAPVTNWITLSNNANITNSGFYAMDKITGNMVIGGTNQIVVTLLLTNGIFYSGRKTLIIASNAWVTLYAGNRITDGGLGTIHNTSQRASQLIVYGLPTLTSFKLYGNGPFWGLVYAPNANAELKGSSPASGYYGAFVFSNLLCTGNTTFSYDEALGTHLSQLLAGSSLKARLNAISGDCEVEVTGYPGFNYAVESSTNLTDWAAQTTNPAPFTLTESNPADSPQRFYRASFRN